MRTPLLLLAALLPAFVRPAAAQGDPAALQRQVMEVERAFAKTMADRDHAAFSRYLSEEAVFFGEGDPLRGKAAVAAGWRPFFDGAAAPFSWDPDVVEVLESGTLALSSGVVRTPDGQVVARFNSIWRQESPGVWRVVFDRGHPVCPPATQ